MWWLPVGVSATWHASTVATSSAIRTKYAGDGKTVQIAPINDSGQRISGRLTAAFGQGHLSVPRLSSRDVAVASCPAGHGKQYRCASKVSACAFYSLRTQSEPK